MIRRINIFQNIDWITVVIYLLLIFFGWICIYGAVYNFEEKFFWDFSERYGKQLVWMGMACVIACVLLTLDSRVYNNLAYPVYGVFLLLLLLTLVLAPNIKGSRSWLVIGPVSLQTAEFAKTATCLALAKFMSSYAFQTGGFRVRNWRNLVALFLMVAVPAGIILLQNETGSAIVYVSLMLVMYREGMPGVILFLVLCCVVFFIVAIRFGDVPIVDAVPDESFGLFLVVMMTLAVSLAFVFYYLKDAQLCKNVLLCTAALFVVSFAVYKVFDVNVRFLYVAYAALALTFVYFMAKLFNVRKLTYLWISLFMIGSVVYVNMADYMFEKVLQPHQRVRIMETLGMTNDLKRSGYNVNQSKIAIGSGGLWGKGFLNGTQTKLKYVPEQDTDFIFCTVGEEHGFVGATLVLGLFLVLLLRLIVLAERQRSLFSRIYGYCVVSILFFHLAINIGMVIGLTPVIGIPLPFFSYGGSSLWGFTILLFIFIRLDASRMEYMPN